MNSTQAFWTGVFTNSALNTDNPSCAIAVGKIVSENYHNYAGEVKFTNSANPDIDNMLSLGFTYNGDILKVKANRTVEIDGNSGTLLRLQNNTPHYQSGQANIEFWTDTTNIPNIPLGMLKTKDTGVAPNGPFQSKMKIS